VTSTQASPEVNELRQLLRYLQEFRSLYELEGIEEITTPSGNVWSLWDLEYLYQRSADLLTSAQYRAITLFLVHDIKEQDAAELMGVSRTNPIGMYAALGLSKLVEFIDAGGLERFRSRRGDWQTDDYRLALGSTLKLAGQIKEVTEVVGEDCWRFLPTPPGVAPRIRLKSRATASGFLYVHPLAVMYIAHGGYIPAGYTVRLRSDLWEHYAECHLACVNHEHARLARLGDDPRRSA
jgi:hypothetical protein